MNIMIAEGQVSEMKLRALKHVMDRIYSLEIFPKQSFNQFRKNNLFFISGMTIKQQRFEFDCFCFFEVCMKIKMNVSTSEIRAFFRNQQGTKKGTEI